MLEHRVPHGVLEHRVPQLCLGEVFYETSDGFMKWRVGGQLKSFPLKEKKICIKSTLQGGMGMAVGVVGNRQLLFWDTRLHFYAAVCGSCVPHPRIQGLE